MTFRSSLLRSPLLASRQSFARSNAALRHAPVNLPRHATQRLSRHASSLSSAMYNGPRIRTIFGALLAFGCATTAYGIYEFLTSFPSWPDEVKSDLRSGIKARHRDEHPKCAAYLDRAWKTTLTLPLDKFGPDPLLKTTGIAASLSEALEQSNRPADAYVVLEQAFAHLYQHTQSSPQSVDSSLVLPEQLTPLRTSPAEAHRAIQLAAHLGTLANLIGRPESEEERWLTYAAQSTAQLLAGSTSSANAQHGPTGSNDQSQIADFALPAWLSPTDGAAPLEALGALYARRGDAAMALPLYLRAATLLLGATKPSPSQPGGFMLDANVPVIDACRGGQVMSNMAELILRTPPSSSALKEQDAGKTGAHRLTSNVAGGLHWTTGALSIFGQADKRRRKGDVDEADACDPAHVAALINMAMLMEMIGSKEEARKHFEEGMVRARAAKMGQVVLEARAALRRLEKE